MDPVCSGKLKYHLKYEELMKFTDNFSEENFVGDFQFGKVYRGKIEQSTHEMQHVMVKIWEDSKIYKIRKGDNEVRLMQEVMLLRHETLKSHPGMIDLFGFCWDNEHLGAVYNFKPLDIVHNLVPKDSFTWLQRIKVAIGFGRLLKYLHSGDPAFKPFMVRNIAAAHIVLDEEYNPRLYEFGMASGGVFPDRTVYKAYYLFGCCGYIDLYTGWSGEWSNKTDVFAFGCLLLNLMTKRVLTEEQRLDDSCKVVNDWAWEHYKCSETENLIYSFVDPSLETDPEFSFGDGRKITKLAMNCIQPDPKIRPSMKQVMKQLLKMQVVKKHTKFLGLDSKLQDGFDGQ